MSKAAWRISKNVQGDGRTTQTGQAQCSIAADTTSYTLSRQRENIAALRVESLPIFDLRQPKVVSDFQWGGSNSQLAIGNRQC